MFEANLVPCPFLLWSQSCAVSFPFLEPLLNLLLDPPLDQLLLFLLQELLLEPLQGVVAIHFRELVAIPVDSVIDSKPVDESIKPNPE